MAVEISGVIASATAVAIVPTLQTITVVNITAVTAEATAAAIAPTITLDEYIPAPTVVEILAEPAIAYAVAEVPYARARAILTIIVGAVTHQSTANTSTHRTHCYIIDAQQLLSIAHHKTACHIETHNTVATDFDV